MSPQLIEFTFTIVRTRSPDSVIFPLFGAADSGMLAPKRVGVEGVGEEDPKSAGATRSNCRRRSQFGVVSTSGSPFFIMAYLVASAFRGDDCEGQMMPSLEVEVVAAAGGSEDAYARLVNHCRGLVTSIALAIVRDVRSSQ